MTASEDDQPPPSHIRVEDSTGADADRWAALAARVLADEGVSGDAEMGLLFVDEERMAALNREHMGAEGPTDVLSFPIDGAQAAAGGLVGDVVICPAVAARNAADHSREVDDEMALLVVHGVLHLLGMDHAEAAEAEAMRDREKHHLAAAGSERGLRGRGTQG